MALMSHLAISLLRGCHLAASHLRSDAMYIVVQDDIVVVQQRLRDSEARADAASAQLRADLKQV